MDVNDVITSVQRQFGDETGAQIVEEDVIRWINDGQLRIARKTEADSKHLTDTVTANSGVFNLPSDFNKMTNVSLVGSSGQSKYLQQVSTKQLAVLYPDIESGAPGVTKFCAVTRVSGTFVLVFAPRPSETVTINIVYKHRPPLVDSASDPLSIPAEYHDDLVTYCLAMAKQLDGDMEAYQQLINGFNSTIIDETHDEKHKDAETYPFIRTSSGDY